MNYRLDTLGLDVLMIGLFQRIDESNMPWLLSAAKRLRDAFGTQLIDLVPSYTTLMLHFDLEQLDECEARNLVERALYNLQPEQSNTTGTRHKVPVWYDSRVGPDLPRIAQITRQSEAAIIKAHCGRDYRVFALGFAPGFGYLGLLDPALIAPRLTTPRQSVPAGSVGIAEHQTAIYPLTSPGGWNLLGRTALPLFDPGLEGYSVLQPGDQVRFLAIDRAEFLRQGGDDTPLQPPGE
jgi:KipI family sensor histidine kinase inhibitor